MLFFQALRDSMREGYDLSRMRADIIAGITVGVVAIPLGMALAIAVGVPPQHGLYTVIVAGSIAAILGGSQVNITGPTAAFVVILMPIVQKFGISGLFLATMMAGLILLIMGICRLGRLVMFVPYPVTTGFTAGIGFSIAFLQLKDLFNLVVVGNPMTFPTKVIAYYNAIPSSSMIDAFIGITSIAAFIGWGKLKTKLPPHVVALVVGTFLAIICDQLDFGHAVLLGEKFTYKIGDLVGHGIPGILPQLINPLSNLDFSWQLINDLLPSAFTIAVLGAIESLLCAVVADGMVGKKHNPNAELVGQGIANMIAPFFGGIPATAAIARTATNARSGGQTPIAAVVHAIFVLVSMLVLAPYLSYIPMSSLAGLLIMVAWNMSEAPHFINTIKVAPRRDVTVLLVCFFLTVVFDMVVAVIVGIGLACLLFIKRVAALTNIRVTRAGEHHHLSDIGDDILIYDINGPMFFGACDKALSVIGRQSFEYKVAVLDLGDVNCLDMTALHALKSAISRLDIPVILYDLAQDVERVLNKASIVNNSDVYACKTKAQLQTVLAKLAK